MRICSLPGSLFRCAFGAQRLKRKNRLCCSYHAALVRFRPTLVSVMQRHRIRRSTSLDLLPEGSGACHEEFTKLSIEVDNVMAGIIATQGARRDGNASSR